MSELIFNHSGHKRLWKYLSENPTIDINTGINQAYEEEKITLPEYEEYINADKTSCRTGCKFANNNCEECAFEMIDPRRCLGGLTDAYLRGYEKFKKEHKKYTKQVKLRENPKFMKDYKRMFNRQKRLANRILNWKVKDGIKTI